VATIEDYAAVRSIESEVIAAGVEATVPATICETVEAVARLRRESTKPVTHTSVARELKLDKSPARRRVLAAIEGGWLRNLEDREAWPALLDLGDPQPDTVPILPEPALLSEGVARWQRIQG
jgi:hypothetical protein